VGGRSKEQQSSQQRGLQQQHLPLVELARQNEEGWAEGRSQRQERPLPQGSKKQEEAAAQLHGRKLGEAYAQFY
jgi:hypothetical protein